MAWDNSTEKSLSAIRPVIVPPPPAELVYVPRIAAPSWIRVNDSWPDETESAKVAAQGPSSDAEIVDLPLSRSETGSDASVVGHK
jgi:hypothetical protein